jgi:ribosomal protein S18 acetylase RimI-like enzyme
VKTKFLTFILISAKIEMPDSSNTSTAIDLLSKANEVVSEEITSETKEIAPYTRIDLGDVSPHNIKLLKKVNQVVFPIVYHDKFYKDVLEAGELAKLAYYNDVVVGAVCCRIDLTPASEDGSQLAKRKLYIMTLGCLAPYRRLGIGTKMLRHVMDIVEKDGNFDSVVLHVQVSNDVALEFYKRFGFEIVETKEAYYKRIEPADAHVLEKKIDKKSVNGAEGEH